MQRRDALARLGRHAAALALGALFAAPRDHGGVRAERLPAGDDPFTLGVASGMPTDASAVLWTRLAPRPREPLGGLPEAPIAVRWEIADDERFSRGLRKGSVLAHPEHAHSVHVEVAGLPSDRRFFYRFLAGDAVSPVGRTRTAPALTAPAGRLRLALASCQHYEQGAFALHREMAGQDLDLVLFVGDYIYESSNARYRRRPHEAGQPTTLAAFRQRHATYKLDADLRAAHAAHPWLLTWDDHEVENDYAGDASRDAQRSPAAFLALRTAAYKAYFEHMPVSPRMAPAGAAMPIHARHRWGRLADLWTLDTRQYRSLQACNPLGRAGGRVLSDCDRFEDPSRSVLGAAQERWLADGLAARTGAWQLIAQGSQLAPAGIGTPLGRSVYSDGWDGYPQARRRLLHSLAGHGGSDVVCLGGDVHRHVVAQLRADPADPRSPVVASEIVTSSLTSRGASESVVALIAGSNPDLLHCRGDERGYALLDLDAQRLRCELRATAFPVLADAAVRTQARFLVERGRPAPRREG